MDKELQCTKIKDGLYLGNCKTAQDAEFLVTNKFMYVVNCSSEIPNIFEGQGIKYLKFKLVRDKTHKLWDQSLKKLRKLQKFIESCQDHSMCCLIHSFDGINRSLVMLAAFLMSRYRWTLPKTLQFIRSKKIFIGLSEHYIQQLQILEQFLNREEPKLTKQWRVNYHTPEEQIISKTYLNSLEIQCDYQPVKEKKNKRVVWKDLVEKQKKKQLKEQREREKVNMKLKKEFEKYHSIDISKKNDKKPEQKKQRGDSYIKDSSLKKFKNKLLKNDSHFQSKPEINYKANDQTDKQDDNIEINVKKEHEFDENQIIKLIKKNLKSKKKLEENCINLTQDEEDEKVYNVTINNFIKPNINILNHNPPTGQKNKVTKKRPQSAWKKEKDKINRTHSEKEGIKPYAVDPKDRSVKHITKKGDQSPSRKERKYEKLTSTFSRFNKK